MRYPQFHGCLTNTYDVESEDGSEVYLNNTGLQVIAISVSIFCGQISFCLHRRGQHLRRSHFSSVEGSRLSGARLLHHSSDRCADVRVLRSYFMSTSILSYWHSWSLLRLAFVNRKCILNHNKTFHNSRSGREVEWFKNDNVIIWYIKKNKFHQILPQKLWFWLFLTSLKNN